MKRSYVIRQATPPRGIDKAEGCGSAQCYCPGGNKVNIGQISCSSGNCSSCVSRACDKACTRRRSGRVNQKPLDKFNRFLNSNGGTGNTIISTGGENYSYDPVLSYDMGCSIMDEMGDGIDPYKSCDRNGNSGIQGMNVSSIRYLNGKRV